MRASCWNSFEFAWRSNTISASIAAVVVNTTIIYRSAFETFEFKIQNKAIKTFLKKLIKIRNHLRLRSHTILWRPVRREGTRKSLKEPEGAWRSKKQLGEKERVVKVLSGVKFYVFSAPTVRRIPARHWIIVERTAATLEAKKQNHRPMAVKMKIFEALMLRQQDNQEINFFQTWVNHKIHCHSFVLVGITILSQLSPGQIPFNLLEANLQFWLNFYKFGK